MCTSSRDAVRHLRKHDVEIMITDIHMPAPDGLELIREALKLHPLVVALAMTGYMDRYTMEAILEAGASDCLSKPFELAELLFRVSSAEKHLRHAEKLQMAQEMISGLEDELKRSKELNVELRSLDQERHSPPLTRIAAIATKTG